MVNRGIRLQTWTRVIVNECIGIIIARDLSLMASRLYWMAITRPQSCVAITPVSIPLNNRIWPVTQYFSIRGSTQSIIRSCFGSISGSFCMYSSSTIHHVLKSCPGFPTHHVHSFILIGFARCNSWLRHCWRLCWLLVLILPTSECGFDYGGGGSPAPPVAPPAAPSLLALPLFLANQVEAPSLSLKLDTSRPMYCCFWELSGVAGPACGACRREYYFEDSETLCPSITVVNTVVTSRTCVICSSIMVICSINSLLDKTSLSEYSIEFSTSLTLWIFEFLAFQDLGIPILVSFHCQDLTSVISSSFAPSFHLIFVCQKSIVSFLYNLSVLSLQNINPRSQFL